MGQWQLIDTCQSIGLPSAFGRDFLSMFILLSRYAGITLSAFISRECKSQMALSSMCFLLFITLALLILPSELSISSVMIPFGHPDLIVSSLTRTTSPTLGGGCSP